MPSFDIVVPLNSQEVDNAINQALKEIASRYDFKGSKSTIEWDKKKEIQIVGDDEYKLKAVLDILESKLIKRGVSIKNLIFSKIESSFEGTVRQKITLQEGIPPEKAKEINKFIKDLKISLQSQYQELKVRVTGKKKDDLQLAIQSMKQKDFGLSFSFSNFRD